MLQSDLIQRDTCIGIVVTHLVNIIWSILIVLGIQVSLKRSRLALALF